MCLAIFIVLQCSCHSHSAINCLFLPLLPLRREKYSWRLWLHNGLVSISSPWRGWRGGWVQPPHVEHLLFSPLPWQLSCWLAWLQKVLNDTQHWGHQARGWERGRGRAVAPWFECVMASVFSWWKLKIQAIKRPQVISICQTKHQSPVIWFWGLQILQCRLMTMYSETVICIPSILITTSGSLYLRLVLFVILAPCSNKQREFHHLRVFILSLSWSQNHDALAWAREKNCLQLQELAGKWALSK